MDERDSRLMRADAAWGAVPLRDVQAFGLRLRGPLPVAHGWASPDHDAPALTVVSGDAADLEAAFSGRVETLWSATIDGHPFAAERGAAGDMLMRHGGVGVYHLTADVTTLQVADLGGAPAACMRTLLDSVLFTVSLECGYHALHGTALDTPAGIVAILGSSGAGKSSLATALGEKGLAFFSDDIVVLEASKGVVTAHAGPPVATVPRGTTHDEAILAVVGDEEWVAREVRDATRPVVGVVVLEAAHDRGARGPLLAVLRHALSVPRERERVRARFALVSELVEQVPVIPLRAHSASPSDLADVVLRELGRLGTRA